VQLVSGLFFVGHKLLSLCLPQWSRLDPGDETDMAAIAGEPFTHNDDENLIVHQSRNGHL